MKNGVITHEGDENKSIDTAGSPVFQIVRYEAANYLFLCFYVLKNNLLAPATGLQASMRDE